MTPVAAVLAAAGAFATPQSNAERLLHEAYWLEHERGDHAAALEKYRDAARATHSAEARAEIEQRMRACEEELATSDFAELVPEDTILYVEMNSPGEQLAKLLGQLGLLQGEDGAGEIAVSPDLLEGVLGMRGAALAVTRVDPTGGIPGGVLILHPGDMKAVRGLIETALPAGGQPTESIGGYHTYLVENLVYVTMCERMVVASTERGLIEDVLRRAGGDANDALTENTDLTRAMSTRDGDLLWFCLNAEPVLPIVQNVLGGFAKRDPEAALALSLADIGSLRSVSGGIGAQDDGLALDVGLEMAEGHRSVAFDLLRMPHLGAGTFDLVPEGVAAFLATSLNERGAGSAGIVDATGRPVVTVMDVGREIFGNIVDVAAFVMPSLSEGPGGQPIPDLALAMTVNDVERSKAIWNLALGFAQGASGGGRFEPKSERAGGAQVDRYSIEGMDVYLFAEGDKLVISPSMRAIEAAAGRGRSIASDPIFGALVESALEDHTSVLGVSLGRVAQVAREIVPPRELAEAEPWLDLLHETTLVARTRHSDTEFAISARLTGLPNVGPMVEHHVRAMQGHARDFAPGLGHSERERYAVALDEQHAAEQAGGLRLEHVSVKGDDDALLAAFRVLVENGEIEAAASILPAIQESMSGDALAMNNFVWGVVESEPEPALAGVLLPMIEHASELTDDGDWYVLDTKAHVLFAAGRVQDAIQTAKRAVAVARVRKDERASEAEATLARFQKEAMR